MRPEYETSFEPKLQQIVNFHFFNHHNEIGSRNERFYRKEMKRFLKEQGYKLSEINEAIIKATEKEDE